MAHSTVFHLKKNQPQVVHKDGMSTSVSKSQWQRLLSDDNVVCTGLETDPWVSAGCVFSGASPYSMGPASQGTATPMMSPAPPGAPQDSMGYNISMNGGDYSSPMSASQVQTTISHIQFL